MEIGNNQQPLLLPQDIIEEILPRLPVKSLLRFRCVSKSWRSIIDSEGFIKTHYQNSMQNPSFPQQRVILHNMRHRPMQCSPQSLLNGPYIDPSPLDDPTNIPMNPFQVVGCYNGLVCILEHPRKFFMWNPSTRIAKKLPEITKRSYVVNSGFGWDESSGEYKVFGFVWDMVSQYKYVGKLYSSKTKSWKTIGHLKLPLCWQVGVFVGEKFYWNRDDIVFLDLKSEVFGRFELPFDRPDLYKSLGVLGGFLCMIYHNRDYHHLRGDTFQVWVMKEYGVKESWERVVTLHHVLDLLERPFSTPMMVGPDGEIMVFYGSTFLVYHPQHNVFRHPKIFNKYGSYHLYVESLVSP